GGGHRADLHLRPRVARRSYACDTEPGGARLGRKRHENATPTRSAGDHRQNHAWWPRVCDAEVCGHSSHAGNNRRFRRDVPGGGRKRSACHRNHHGAGSSADDWGGGGANSRTATAIVFLSVGHLIDRSYSLLTHFCRVTVI